MDRQEGIYGLDLNPLPVPSSQFPVPCSPVTNGFRRREPQAGCGNLTPCVIPGTKWS